MQHCWPSWATWWAVVVAEACWSCLAGGSCRLRALPQLPGRPQRGQHEPLSENLPGEHAALQRPTGGISLCSGHCPKTEAHLLRGDCPAGAAWVRPALSPYDSGYGCAPKTAWGPQEQTPVAQQSSHREIRVQYSLEPPELSGKPKAESLHRRRTHFRVLDRQGVRELEWALRSP